MLRRNHKSQGQALVEFALIATVLLLIIFLIIESARILQGWVTVQNAARVGARYAITGQDMGTCPLTNLPKYASRCSDLRVASVITVTHTALAGLPLNEDPTSDAFSSPPDENSYDIQVWGGVVSQGGPQLLPDFAGSPGQPVVVRAVYNVPVITPFFRPIIEVIPVFGQVMMNNENFGQLGNPTAGIGAPPIPGPLPTVGATPTPTPSPTPTDTPTPGPTPVPPTLTPSATPALCGLFFEDTPVAGHNFVLITGEIGTRVTIIDANTGQTLGSDILLDVQGKRCPGFADFSPPNQLGAPLVAGHVIIAQPDDVSQPAQAIVIQGTATPTVPPTFTPLPTNTPTVVPSNTPTPTPSNPFIVLRPNCAVGPTISVRVEGYNWPDNRSVNLFWDGSLQSIVPSGHGGTFVQNWTKQNQADGTHVVSAVATGASDSADFLVPCPFAATPTVQATSTPTPRPEDLIVVGPPEVLSTRPLVAFRPIDVRVTISNTGDIDVSSLFFVDIYFDPTGTVSPTIPLNQSYGYMAVSSLAGNASRVLTITANLGFQNQPENHLVYAMVDSDLKVSESDETNNVSTPLAVNDVTPAPTPTPTATPVTGNQNLSGVVRIRLGNWVPQARANVVIIDEGSGLPIGAATTDGTGTYQYMVPPGTYTVKSCVLIDNVSYFGIRVGIVAPSPFADIYLLRGPCS